MNYDPEKSALFIHYARELLGTPFLKEGCTKEGVDCCGIAIYSLKKMGQWDDKPLPPIVYPLVPGFLHNFFIQYAIPINFSDLKPGDWVLFSYMGYEQHAGMITDKGLLHAYDVVGKVVETTFDSRWHKRYRQGYRIKWQ